MAATNKSKAMAAAKNAAKSGGNKGGAKPATPLPQPVSTEVVSTAVPNEAAPQLYYYTGAPGTQIIPGLPPGNYTMEQLQQAQAAAVALGFTQPPPQAAPPLPVADPVPAPHHPSNAQHIAIETGEDGSVTVVFELSTLLAGLRNAQVFIR